MKENKLLEMKNKVDSLTRVLQHVMNEMRNLTDLSIGTLEAVKKMPGYEEAIEKLKEDLKKSEAEQKEKTPKLELNDDKS
jgi:predicted ATP-grasp superfamily ATP-dependent carboligase